MESIASLYKKFPNQDLLGFAATSFFLFVVSELIAAGVSGSLSLLADAVAMSVDVATYGFNMLAERAKDNDNLNSITSRFYIEILIPSFAITTLFTVTIYFTSEAIKVLQDTNRQQDNINIVYLYVFPGINLIVDVACMAMFFCRGRDVFIEKKELLPMLSLDTSEDGNDDDDELDDEFGRLDDDIFRLPSAPSSSYASGSNNHDNMKYYTNSNKDNSNSKSSTVTNTTANHSESSSSSSSNGNSNSSSSTASCDCFGCSDTSHETDNPLEKKNLNMLSAFAHIGGDSMRTVSVLIAAFVSTVTGASVDACDAWAAIVVSIMIIIFMLPLLVDIIRAAVKLYRESRRQEASTSYSVVSSDEEFTI